MTSIDPTGTADLRAALTKSLHEHWRLLLIEGIVLVVLGLAAIAVPLVAGLAVTIYLGWIFLIGGVVGLVATLRARQAPGFGWALLSAVLALVAGGLLLWNPMQGLVTLTYVLIAFFVIDGFAMIFFAIAHRRELSHRWQWLMVNGFRSESDARSRHADLCTDRVFCHRRLRDDLLRDRASPRALASLAVAHGQWLHRPAARRFHPDRAPGRLCLGPRPIARHRSRLRRHLPHRDVLGSARSQGLTTR